MVKIVDGTMCSMPETAPNRERWPQSSWQKPGLGFPLMKLVGLFSPRAAVLCWNTRPVICTCMSHSSFASSGRVCKSAMSFWADRGFCSYAAIASLALRGVDSVMRLHQMRKVDFRSGKALGQGERLVTLDKAGAENLGTECC